MKMQSGAGPSLGSDAGHQTVPRNQGPADYHVRHGDDPIASWLRGTFNKIIHEQRPRVPGWGVLVPNQIVGEYVAEDGYLLLVFDHRGRPHTQRFTRSEIVRLKVAGPDTLEQFRTLIDSFCADA